MRGPDPAALRETIAERRCRRIAGAWTPPGLDARHKITRPWSAVMDALAADPRSPAVVVIEADAGLGKSVLLARTIEAIRARGGRGLAVSAAELAGQLASRAGSQAGEPDLAEAVAAIAARHVGIAQAAWSIDAPGWLAIDDLDRADAADQGRLLAALDGPGPLRCVIATRPGGARPRGATVWQLLPFDASQRRQALERRLDPTDAAALRARAIADPALDALLDVPLFCAAACELVRGGGEPHRLTRRALYRACVDQPRLDHRTLGEYRTARALAPSIRAGDPDALVGIGAALAIEAPATGLPWMLVAEGADAATLAHAIRRERGRAPERHAWGTPDRGALAPILDVWLEVDAPPPAEVAALLDEAALCLERAQRRRRDGSWVELDDAALAAAALTVAARAGLSAGAADVLAAVRVVRGHRGHDPARGPGLRDRARWSSLAGAVERGLADRCAVVRWCALWAATATAVRRGDPGFALADRAAALVDDPAPALRSLACRALVALGHDDAPRLAGAAFAGHAGRDAGHADRDARAGAAIALGVLATAAAGDALLAAADAIVAAPIDAGDPVPAAVFGALEAWADQLARGHAPAPPVAAAALASRFARALDRGLPRIGAIAASGLGKVGDVDACEPLAALLGDRSERGARDPRVEASAAFALERLCHRFARRRSAELRAVIPRLRDRLAHGPDDVRRHVAAALHHLAGAGALDDRDLRLLAVHAGDDDDRVAAACSQALVEAATSSPA